MSAAVDPLVAPLPAEVPLNHAPLVRVIAQLRFPEILSVEQRDFVAPFQEAIRQNPEMIDAYILLADLHVQLGEDGEAVRLANLAEQLNPADPRLPTLRGKIR